MQEYHVMIFLSQQSLVYWIWRELIFVNLTFNVMKIKTDYLDLFKFTGLIWKYYHAYRELEKMYEEGLIKSIGISNYQKVSLLILFISIMLYLLSNQIKTTMRGVKENNFIKSEWKRSCMQGYQVFGKEETLSVMKIKKWRDSFEIWKISSSDCNEVFNTKWNKCHYKTNGKTMDGR